MHPLKRFEVRIFTYAIIVVNPKLAVLLPDRVMRLHERRDEVGEEDPLGSTRFRRFVA